MCFNIVSRTRKTVIRQAHNLETLRATRGSATNLSTFMYNVISFPDFNKQRILELVKDHVDVYAHDLWVSKLPSILDRVIFKELNIPITDNKAVLIGCFKKGIENIDVHSDNWSGNIFRAINIPLENCNEMYMNWYNVIDEDKIFLQGHEGRYNPVKKIPLQYTKCIASINCNTPFIADVNQWHAGEMRGDGVAVMLSVRVWPFSAKPFDKENIDIN